MRRSIIRSPLGWRQSGGRSGRRSKHPLLERLRLIVESDASEVDVPLRRREDRV